MTVTGTGKSDLHKQNLRVCFFNEQKCRYSGTRNIVILWTLVDNFFYNLQLEESYKSSMTDVFEPSEHGPSDQSWCAGSRHPKTRRLWVGGQHNQRTYRLFPKKRRKPYLRYLWLDLNKTKTVINQFKNTKSYSRSDDSQLCFFK
jgi:hypothetical protein